MQGGLRGPASLATRVDLFETAIDESASRGRHSTGIPYNEPMKARPEARADSNPVPDAASFEGELGELIDEARSSCLWYLRPDYRPRTDPEIEATLRAIERRGDRATFARARRLRQWHSRRSNVASAAS